jgi:hypothetical protein
MHHLGVPTTRALSLVVSETEKVQRPWYRDESLFGTGPAVIDEDDPRLAQYGKEERQRIIRQVRRQYKSDPNVMVSESAAITCRVCRSFTRIGHIDLFARRAEKASMTAASDALPESGYYTDSPQWKELEQLIWHACYREFRESAYDPYKASDQIGAAATVMLQQSAQRLAAMAGHWIRVGFAQLRSYSSFPTSKCRSRTLIVAFCCFSGEISMPIIASLLVRSRPSTLSQKRTSTIHNSSCLTTKLEKFTQGTQWTMGRLGSWRSMIRCLPNGPDRDSILAL